MSLSVALFIYLSINLLTILHLFTRIHTQQLININYKGENITMFNNYEELLTIEELCEALYIGRNTAYALLNQGKIKAFKIGRTWKIPRIALEEYIIESAKIKKN